MRLQDHQKRMALRHMTEEETPFKPSRTQKIFKNAANVTLRGNTYDATHMDKFLSSGFGERSIQIGDPNSTLSPLNTVSARAGPGGGGGSSMMNYLMSGTTNSIKPSVSFISMSRKDYKQNIYTDEIDGPSPMQILGNEKSFKDKHSEIPTVFEKERDEHMSVVPSKTEIINEAKQLLYKNYKDLEQSDSSALSYPKTKRDEIFNMRRRLDEYNKFKQNHILMGRRERTIKGGWRHGITGIDNADSQNTSVFYQDTKKAKDFADSEKSVINNKRLQSLKVCFGTSSQMPISSDDHKRTKSLLQQKEETVIDIADKWNNKHIVPGSIAELDTQKRIYQYASNIDRTPEDGCMKKIKIERSLKLRKEDFRNRSTNIITNNVEPEQTWLNSFGDQRELPFYKTAMPKIAQIHEEKNLISNHQSAEDSANDSLRTKMDYKPKMNITHSSSIRYKFVPKDNQIW